MIEREHDLRPRPVSPAGRELPGFKKDDVEVCVSGSTLTLTGQKSSEETEEKGTYYLAEIVRGSFT